MSCDKRCFDKTDKWYKHGNCSTCPGQDSGKSDNFHGNFCFNCDKTHLYSHWPHEPEPEEKE